MTRTVLTIGANAGIGLATVLELARLGLDSVGSVRSTATARTVRKAAKDAGRPGQDRAPRRRRRRGLRTGGERPPTLRPPGAPGDPAHAGCRRRPQRQHLVHLRPRHHPAHRLVPGEEARSRGAVGRAPQRGRQGRDQGGAHRARRLPDRAAAHGRTACSGRRDRQGHDLVQAALPLPRRSGRAGHRPVERVRTDRGHGPAGPAHIAAAGGKGR